MLLVRLKRGNGFQVGFWVGVHFGLKGSVGFTCPLVTLLQAGKLVVKCVINRLMTSHPSHIQ